MTRTLNIVHSRPCGTRMQRQRRRGIEPAVIERAAGDGAAELLRARRQQRAHVVERGKRRPRRSPEW